MSIAALRDLDGLVAAWLGVTLFPGLIVGAI